MQTSDQNCDQLIKRIEDVNAKLQDDFIRGLPLGLCHNEYLTWMELSDLINVCPPVLAFKYNNLLDFLKDRPHHIKIDLLKLFQIWSDCYGQKDTGLKVRDNLDNMPFLKLEMDTFLELRQKSDSLCPSQDQVNCGDQQNGKALKDKKKRNIFNRSAKKLRSCTRTFILNLDHLIFFADMIGSMPEAQLLNKKVLFLFSSQCPDLCVSLRWHNNANRINMFNLRGIGVEEKCFRVL
ncbi:hypothetical protein ACKWTF_001406 [Chironomus riparius]